MEKENKFFHYQRGLKRKAIDHMLWLNFIHRNTRNTYKLTQTQEGDFMIVHHSFSHGTSGLYRTRTFYSSYKRMKYGHIAEIAKDYEPLEHWEAIRGLFASLDGELLRYIIKYQIPLHKFIRHELAARGFDENHQWCGFEKASEVWLK